MKDKWMKFFRSGTRAEVDMERALKNEYSNIMAQYITENKETFNDKQLIKCLNLLTADSKHQMKLEREKLVDLVFSSIMNGNFDFRKGNTLAE